MGEQQTKAEVALAQCRAEGHGWPAVREAMTDRQFRTTRSRCRRCHARRVAVLRTDLDEPTIEISITEDGQTVSYLEDLVLPKPAPQPERAPSRPTLAA
ncbi:hypothetical protein [uncultured Friedmanniella sp.]|uniref:hypothetical protein n=1 Tax=uncultured Friedmanniella sp. TaxID=335381 RepID=UPI0035C98508